MDPIAFQKKWIGSTLKERSASQSHFNDLCAVLGVPTPTEADPAGEFYTFERGAEKSGGGNGWADVWFRGHFGWEYKGPKADLHAAYRQLQQYREDLENPPLLIVSDLNVFEIHTNFTGTIKQVHSIDLQTFAEPDNQRLLRRVWDDPDSFRPGITRATVTQDAARAFGQIAIGMHGRGVEPNRAAHYLMQLLFCLFAEDIGVLPNRVFSRMVAFGIVQPARFTAQARELLEAMRSGGDAGYEVIPHVNGGLFLTVDPVDLTAEELGTLQVAAELDWSAVEPAIFGTLFERSLDPAKRAQLGAHYTGRHDIERVVDPVVMDPLRRRWDEVRTRAEVLRAEMEAAKGRTRENRRASIGTLIGDFLDELAAVRVLDPACGSGNFLYVALERLLTLEKEIITWRATNAGYPLGFPAVEPRQMLGLEINEYAQQLAQVAIWIGYVPWRIGNGFGWREPLLDPLETIRLQDALLETDPDTGEVREATWPEADFIIGNPPFLGGNRIRQELGGEYVEALFDVYENRVPQFADLCCYFFEKGRAAMSGGDAKRAGLLATNSIRGGVNRRVLQRIKESGDIFFAWSDEPWILEGAAVRISIVGFDDGSESGRFLDGNEIGEISASLNESQVAIWEATQLRENADLGYQGDTKGGAFELASEQATQMLKAPTNPNGRTNRDVVIPWVGSQEVVGRPRGMWIVDFGIGMSETEASLYELPFAYVEQIVKPVRAGNAVARTAAQWWLHRRPVAPMRKAIAEIDRYIATVRHSRHRLFVWLDSSSLPDSALIAFAREDDYFFGVLHSRAHEVWSLRMGTWLGKGNDPRYTPTTCFETFPLPWPPGTEPVDDPRVVEIGAAAAELDALRCRWLDPEGASEAELKKRTLTSLYNQRPTWLRNAHARLDRAVWVAYGWDDPDPATVDEDTILARLLALNLERAGRPNVMTS